MPSPWELFSFQIETNSHSVTHSWIHIKIHLLNSSISTWYSSLWSFQQLQITGPDRSCIPLNSNFVNLAHCVPHHGEEIAPAKQLIT